MRNSRFAKVLLALSFLAAATFLSGCGSGRVSLSGTSGDVPASTEVTISTVKVVRLDGTELDLTDMPIPRSVRVQYTFSNPLSSAEDRQAFEGSVSIVDDDGLAVDGLYEWAADFLSVTYTPTFLLKYKTQYSITIDTTSLPVVNTSKASDIEEMSFVTMTKHDINGDGFVDAMVGASEYDQGSKNGRAYVFLGSAAGIENCDLSSPACIPNATITGGAADDNLGSRFAIVGDLNADGYGDIAVGAPGHNSNMGQMYVFLGSSSGINDCDLSSSSCAPDAIMTGANDDDTFGYDISGGDINGDGYDDIAVGSINYELGNALGRVYIFHGSSSGIESCDLQTCSANSIITGENSNDSLGAAISIAGDVNGDGYGDLIAGAPNYTDAALMQGRVYLFLGSSIGIANCDLRSSCTADATITGENLGNLLGFALSMDGDVNGDGYDDVLIGAIGFPNLDQNGRTYIFHGSANGIANCDLSSGLCNSDTAITGEYDQDWLGHSVSIANDVNGDGYDDVIVGAPLYGVRSAEGKAYFFLGSQNGIDDCDLRPPSTCTPDATMTGKDIGSTLGFSVSGAGDVNGDGYGDVIISSEAYPNYARRGEAYIFLGSQDGIDNCDLSSCDPDSTLTGANDGDKFGVYAD